MRVSYGSDQLWLGDKTGKLHLVDATDGDFNLVEVSRARIGRLVLHATNQKAGLLLA